MEGSSSNVSNHGEKRKLFVGGLPTKADEDTLTTHFSQHGEVEESLIIIDRETRKHRGFGFVTFVNSSMAVAALQSPHVILGKRVDVHYANPRTPKVREEDDDNNNDYYIGEVNAKKIFIGGLPLDITKEELKSFFNKFGEITEATIVIDRQNQRSRGFGFITFDLEESANNLLKNKSYELKNKKVEIKRAMPRVNKNYNINVHDMNYYYYPYYNWIWNWYSGNWVWRNPIFNWGLNSYYNVPQDPMSELVDEEIISPVAVNYKLAEVVDDSCDYSDVEVSDSANLIRTTQERLIKEDSNDARVDEKTQEPVIEDLDCEGCDEKLDDKNL